MKDLARSLPRRGHFFPNSFTALGIGLINLFRFGKHEKLKLLETRPGGLVFNRNCSKLGNANERCTSHRKIQRSHSKCRLTPSINKYTKSRKHEGKKIFFNYADLGPWSSSGQHWKLLNCVALCTL
jgi:hypothetical protein